MNFNPEGIKQLEIIFMRYLTGEPGSPLPALSEFLAAAPPAGVYVEGHQTLFVHIHFKYTASTKLLSLDFARRKTQLDLKAWWNADTGGAKAPWSEREEALLKGLANPPKILPSGLHAPRIVAFATCRFPEPTEETPKGHRIIGGLPLQMDIVDYSFSGLDNRNVDVDWAAAYKTYVNGPLDSRAKDNYQMVYYTTKHIAAISPAWVERATHFWNSQLSMPMKQEIMQLAIDHFPPTSVWEPQEVAYAWTRTFESVQSEHVEKGWITQAGINYATGM
ncbi:hypothetical protein RQP46_010454 [Phenoliferia psychrophenolica]